MAQDAVAVRYAQALFESARVQEAIEPTTRVLEAIGSAMKEEPQLRRLLMNPEVEPQEKVELLQRATAIEWSELVRAFIFMVVSWDRAQALPEMAEAFQEAVDAHHGRVRAIVRSAHPISEQLLERLRAVLEKLERRKVELVPEVEPSLIGGLQVQMGYRVVDGSVKRQLEELRERLLAVPMT